MKNSLDIRTKRRSRKFNPSHEEINTAVNRFLNKGGKITVIKPEKKKFKKSSQKTNAGYQADDYLLDPDYSSFDSIA